MSIILTRLASGGYKITQTGGLTKFISHIGYDSDYNSDRTAIEIFLVNNSGGVESNKFGFSDWTINGISGFLDIEAVAAALDAAGVGFKTASGGSEVVNLNHVFYGVEEYTLNSFGTYKYFMPVKHNGESKLFTYKNNKDIELLEFDSSFTNPEPIGAVGSDLILKL